MSAQQFNVGDIVRVEVIEGSDADRPISWEAIVVDVDPDDDDRIEVAWLGRNATSPSARITPYKEVWDDSISCVEVDVDATVTLLKKASYSDAIGAVR